MLERILKENNALTFLYSIPLNWRVIPTAEKKLVLTLTSVALASFGLTRFSKNWGYGWAAFSLTLPFMRYFISDKPHQDKTVNEYREAKKCFEDHAKGFPIDGDVNSANRQKMEDLCNNLGGEAALERAALWKINP